MTMIFSELAEFTNEFKRLAKKYHSLAADFTEFKRVISVRPLGDGKHFNVITKNDFFAIVKARLFCRYLQGAALRVIYAHYFAGSKIEFLEIYYKGKQEAENNERIKGYLKKHV
jgi:hypothetical protein